MRDQVPKEDVQLSAAECAARTGLTVRALRVYERKGLLRPPRSASGWRHYGRDELIRINTICVLKEAGLTLAQMRAILHQQGLQLEVLLMAQIEGWKAKQEQAERGRILANAALQRVRAGNGLSVDQLCALVRSIDASSTDPTIRPLVLRLLDMPPERRAEVIRTRNEEWSPRWLQDYQEALRTRLDPDLERLMDAGVPPSSPQAQRLVNLQLQLMTQFRVREEAVSWFSKAHGPEPGSVGQTASTGNDRNGRPGDMDCPGGRCACRSVSTRLSTKYRRVVRHVIAIAASCATSTTLRALNFGGNPCQWLQWA
ncbi:MAG TPA: MerR family transcriptional regulator [Steroidobacteraceae bacterium]